MSTERQPQARSIDEIRDWFESVAEPLLAHRAIILAASRGGGLLAGSRFYAMSSDEVDQFFSSQRRELEDLAVFAIMASAEAAVRADYVNRIERGKSDPLSKAYAVLRKTLGPNERPSLDEHILQTMKDACVVPNHFISNFRDALRLRHWLAHGRYWVLTLGRNSYAPDDIYRTVHELLAAISA